MSLSQPNTLWRDLDHVSCSSQIVFNYYNKQDVILTQNLKSQVEKKGYGTSSVLW